MRGALGFLLFILFVFPALTAAMCVASFSTWLLDRDFYVQTFSNPKLYAAVLSGDLCAEMTVSTSASSSGSTRTTRPMTDDEKQTCAAYTQALRDVLPDAYINKQVTSVVDGFFAFLNTPNARLDISIDARPVKQDLAGDGGVRFAQTLADNLPVCAARATPTDLALPTCRPADVTPAAFVETIQGQLPAFIEGIPDTIPLADPNGRNPVRNDGSTSVGAGIGTWLLTTFAPAVLSLLIVGFIAAQSWRGKFIWWGVMLLLSAGFVALVGLAATGTLSALGSDLMTSGNLRTDIDSETFLAIANELFPPLANRIGGSLLVVGAIGGVIGLVLMGIGLGIPKPRKDDDLGVGGVQTI